MKSECYLKLALWQFEQQEVNKTVLGEQEYATIINNCEKATQINPKNQESWHYYSLMNYEACIFYSKKYSEEYLVEKGGSAHPKGSSPIGLRGHQPIFDDFSPHAAF